MNLDKNEKMAYTLKREYYEVQNKNKEEEHE